MFQTLVIGSTVVDVLINIPVLPGRGEDVNTTSVAYSIGGCAYNVYRILQLMKSPAMLCSPVGTGIYGRMVKEQLERESLSPFVRLEEENGCCFCLVEPDGERSFISYHGAEYRFSKSWMKNIDFSKTNSVYICGIEVEDPDGNEIVEFVCEHPELELYFAPGPRITQIPHERMEALLSHRDSKGKGPFFHLNENETLRFTGKRRLKEGAEFIAEKTESGVVVTLGERGCYCLSKAGEKGNYIPGFPARVIDTVGAGDAHCGAVIASLKEGMTLEDACLRANKTGAAVAGVQGAIPEIL
ncbi:MAG: PfkB family carbohydrate kinase [Treponema sp.]|jgi:sugar/nucleoside kinase (ribokinase family)|nr:PfkB family carbohydrate kinase [Treponema sp.]